MKNVVRIFKKRASHGFTLVEMIIAVALLGVLLAGMVILVSPVLNTFNDNEKLLTAESVSSVIQEYFSRSLRNASRVVVVTNATYDDNSSNDDIKKEVKKLNDFITDTSVNGVPQYSIKCLSLRCVDGKYYVCDEPLNLSLGDSILTGNSNYSNLQKKVFSDCLYNDLYLDYKIAMGEVSPGVDPITGQPLGGVPSNNFLQMDIDVYTDAARKELVCSTTSVMELRQIKFQLRAGKSTDNYYVKTINVTGEDPADTNKDIYIYYVSRLLDKVGA